MWGLSLGPQNIVVTLKYLLIHFDYGGGGGCQKSLSRNIPQNYTITKNKDYALSLYKNNFYKLIMLKSEKKNNLINLRLRNCPLDIDVWASNTNTRTDASKLERIFQ